MCDVTLQPKGSCSSPSSSIIITSSRLLLLLARHRGFWRQRWRQRRQAGLWMGVGLIDACPLRMRDGGDAGADAAWDARTFQWPAKQDVLNTVTPV
jgi:hypothetical protein